MSGEKDILFGTAGSPANFQAEGFKASADLPGWLRGKGLDAYEYSAGRGVHIKEDTAALLGEAARREDIRLSLHAPYFINLAISDPAQQEKNRRYFTAAAMAARAMGTDRVVFHAGGQGKWPRAAALELTKKNLADVLEELARRGLDGARLLPETMGKKGQIGTLEEVTELCLLCPERLRPAVDFGHLHALTGGRYIDRADYAAAFDYIGERLGQAVLRDLHVHFSRIEFTGAGEKKHWTFADPYGPPFEPMLDVMLQYRLTPRVICESAGTQEVDARAMKEYYLTKKGGL
jgi:deoxyribonuclease-4